jgi:protein-tyrosine phosphatase
VDIGLQIVIDLHCHLLPGIDDGAPDLETALEMARIAVADGIRTTACTPHIMPGYYENTGPDIVRRTAALQAELDAAGVPLKLTTGADVHLVPGLAAGLREGRLLPLAGSKYFLFEPPHHVAPPRLEEAVFDVMAAGWRPLITHPERLRWIEGHYEIMARLAHAGAWMQITAGSLTGRFGERAKHWAERMLDDGLVHVLATDAHNLRNRKPQMAEARALVAQRLGEEAATHMVLTRPRAVLADAAPSSVPPAIGAARRETGRRGGLFRRLFRAA